MKRIINVGMDVHRKSVRIAALSDDGEVVLERGMPNSYKQIKSTVNLLKKKYSGSKIRCCYEAGPSGYGLVRKLREDKIECVVVAPGKIPRKKNERVKTDRKDALDLARLLALGALSEIAVPEKEDEEVRELLRYRNKKKEELKRVKKQLKSFLLRQEMKAPCPGTWTKKHKEWIRKSDCGSDGLNKVKEGHLADILRLEEEVKELEKDLRVRGESERYEMKLRNLQRFRGVGFLTALSFIVEIGDFNRFSTAAQFMGFLGLVPSEHSSGERITRGGITKTGNKQLRKLLVEASWHYFMHGSLKTEEGEDDKYQSYAIKADHRLRRKKFWMLQKQKKKDKVVVTALARELAGFIWGMMTENIAS